MRTLHGLIKAHNKIVLGIKLRVNIRVIVTVSLISDKLKICKGVKRERRRICALILKSYLPDLTRIGIVYVHTDSCAYSLTLSVNLAVTESVNAIIVINRSKRGIKTGIEYRSRSLIFYVKITVSVANNGATSLSVGIDISHCSLTVRPYSSAVLINARKNS